MGKGFAITNQKVSISIGLQGRIHVSVGYLIRAPGWPS